MIYDIRTTELARQTLVNITGVPLAVWEENIIHEDNFRYIDDYMADMINTYGHLPKSYTEFEFIYSHITSSANGCLSYRNNGILDLRQSYLCAESELRQFLNQHNIYIDLENCILRFYEKEYDISHYPNRPRTRCIESKCWAVGRKFYYDFTTCGFLSVSYNHPYGGMVHHRPEVLYDIDNLLGLNLSEIWHLTHDSYEVVAKVNGNQIIYDGEDYYSDKEKVLDFLVRAYNTAFGMPTEQVLLIKNNVQIPPENILEVKPLEFWKTY